MQQKTSESAEEEVEGAHETRENAQHKHREVEAVEGPTAQNVQMMNELPQNEHLDDDSEEKEDRQEGQKNHQPAIHYVLSRGSECDDEDENGHDEEDQHESDSTSADLISDVIARMCGTVMMQIFLELALPIEKDSFAIQQEDTNPAERRKYDSESNAGCERNDDRLSYLAVHLGSVVARREDLDHYSLNQVAISKIWTNLSVCASAVDYGAVRRSEKESESGVEKEERPEEQNDAEERENQEEPPRDDGGKQKPKRISEVSPLLERLMSIDGRDEEAENPPREVVPLPT